MIIETEFGTIQTPEVVISSSPVDLSQSIRDMRDKLLADTDWTQLKDIPDEISSKYLEYRQALRDVTSQPGFPMNVEWPILPE